MDVKQFSLNDIFALLGEACLVMADKPVTVVSEKEDGSDQKRTPMSLHSFIGMSVARELTNPSSRLGFDMRKEDVISAMSANHYPEEAHPEYEYFGVIFRGGSKRKTRQGLRK
jgi:hypothetical protein